MSDGDEYPVRVKMKREDIKVGVRVQHREDEMPSPWRITEISEHGIVTIRSGPWWILRPTMGILLRDYVLYTLPTGE